MTRTPEGAAMALECLRLAVEVATAHVDPDVLKNARAYLAFVDGEPVDRHTEARNAA